MGQMGWGSYLETGHLEIDSQHRTLVDLVNQLDAALAHGSPEGVQARLLDVKAFTESHFRREEELMDQTRYPGILRHRNAHRAFEKQLEDLVEGHLRGTLDLAVKAHDLLQDWNPMHILTEDQELVDYMRKLPPGA